jgi:hypothetical protein
MAYTFCDTMKWAYHSSVKFNKKDIFRKHIHIILVMLHFSVHSYDVWNGPRYRYVSRISNLEKSFDTLFDFKVSAKVGNIFAFIGKGSTCPAPTLIKGHIASTNASKGHRRCNYKRAPLNAVIIVSANWINYPLTIEPHYRVEWRTCNCENIPLCLS